MSSLEQLSGPSAGISIFLERYPNIVFDLTLDHGILQSIRQCCTVLSEDLTVYMDADGNPRLIPSVEKLRRLCTRYLGEKKGNEELQEAIVFFCDAFAKGVETLKQVMPP